MITEKRPSKPSLRQAQNTASATQTVTPSADSWWLSSREAAYREVPDGGNHTRLTKDGVDIIPVGCAWLDKAKLHGERSRTILPGQGFDRLNLPDWELEIRKAVRE